MEKNYKMNIMGLENLDEKMLAELIDNLVELYIQNYGIDFKLEDDEPEKPDFKTENLDIAKNYLQKFRLH
jgi:CRISPR/Cas system endoribonuclease Cas6 (RAMP superfamily)